MDHAIVVAAGTGLDGEKLSPFGQIVFGEIPQFKRLIITAQRAGIKRFSIIIEKDDTSLKNLLVNDKRIESDIEWHPVGTPVSFSSTPSLILQSNLVTTPSALSDLINHKINQEEILLLIDQARDAWLKSKGDRIEDIFLSGGKAVGAFMASGKLLEKSIMDSMDLKTWVQELISRDKVTFTNFSDGYWMRLTSDDKSAKMAEDLLFSHVGKTMTGWISKNINSKISLRLSRYLVRTPLSPNMISILINIIGMLCGPFYAIGHPVWGAVFLQIATVLDRCDGEVARIKLLETKRGQWVDTVSDQVTILSFIIGVTFGYYNITKSPLVLVFGTLNLGIFIFFLIWSFYFLHKYTNSGSLVSYFKVDKLVGKENRTILHKLILIIRPMGRKNFYSLAFLVAAILVGYPLVFLGLTISLILFLIHQVEDIILIKRLKPATSTE
jgi:CDP-L-myo-inositol myo-inositolphosphotransferase